MKTRIITIIAAVLFSSVLFADDLKKNMKEEVYINDIPFDTYTIKNEVMQYNALKVQYEMAEEEYINDIPFSTTAIAVENSMTIKILTDMQDEEYIDDIPFNTTEVVRNLK